MGKARNAIISFVQFISFDTGSAVDIPIGFFFETLTRQDFISICMGQKDPSVKAFMTFGNSLGLRGGVVIHIPQGAINTFSGIIIQKAI